MTGLLFFGVIGLWLVIAIAIASRIGSRVPERSRWLVKVVVFLAVAVLPIADDLIGGFQFRAICDREASRLRIAVVNPAGRTTRITIEPSNRYLDGVAIPIRHSHIEYHDVVTGELVVAYDRYVAEAGFLVRKLRLSESNRPMTVDRSSCSPEQDVAVHRTLNFAVVN